MAPAKTGKDNNNKIVVIKTAHPKRGTRSKSIPNPRKLENVVIKLTAPNKEDTPAK